MGAVRSASRSLRAPPILLVLVVGCGGAPGRGDATGASGGPGSAGASGDASTSADPSSGGDASSGSTSAGGGATGSSSSGDMTTTGDASSEGSSSSGGDPPAAGLTLLSLNLHCLRLDGTKFVSNADRFAAIAALAAARDVGVLALQEACERPGESAIDALQAALEAASGEAWSQTWALAHVAWEGTPDEADEGVGLLVRGALADPGALEHAVQGPLRRIAVSATLPAELGGARVTSVHFEVLEEAARTMQAREVAVAAMVDGADAPAVIVAGDFNDVEGSPTQAAMPTMGFIAADAGLDPAGIDHVMIHRRSPLRPAAVEEVFLGDDAVSDHPGILVRLEEAAGDRVSVTKISAEVDVGADHFVSLRGDLAPLEWELGWPLRQVAADLHVFMTTELAGDFEFKALLDDVTWQSGANVIGVAGAEQSVSPIF